METIQNELNKNGIQIVGPIDTNSVNNIANFVAKTLCTRFPDLKLNYNTLFASISRLKMYIANMPFNPSGACYFYKNASIYFQNGLSLNAIKRLAIHECIHFFQEIKDSKGTLHRLGLCSYFGNRAYGNAMNEASVQLMSAYAIRERRDTVTYYGITLPTDSPSYYPLLCNLIKQVGYITGFAVMFESTFYANDAFYNKMKINFGEKVSYKIQQNFEKILSLEEKLARTSNQMQNEELPHYKYKSFTNEIVKIKNNIKKVFFSTQNLIITSFFDSKLVELTNTAQIENYRKYLYNFSGLIGTAQDYTFFNEYYINKMAQLDEIYRTKLGNNVNSLAIVKKSKISEIFGFLRKIFGKEAQQTQRQYENMFK